MARGGGMREVDLLDGAADDEPPEPSAPRARRWRWWASGVAVAAVLALAGTQWVVDQRDAAEVARLSAVPGVLPPLGESLHVVRNLAERDVASLRGGIDTGEASASLVVAADGSQTLTAVDERTGTTVWSTPLLGPDAERAKPASAVYGGTCEAGAPPGEAAAFAACLVTDGFLRITEDGTQDVVGPTTTRVAAIDTRDGHVLAEWPTEDGAELAVVAGLVVVGLRDAESGVEIVAHDPTTGAERWRYTEPWAEDPTAIADAMHEHFWTFFAAGDVVAFGNGGTLTLLSPEGVVVRDGLRVGGSDGTIGVDPATGELSLATYASTGDVGTTTLVSADGEPAGDRVLDGHLLRISVDDGSVPGLVLTALGQLHAWDHETGRARWSADVRPGDDAIVVRGRVYLGDDTSLVALDGRTGRTVWTTPAAVGPGALATDGRHVLVPSTSASGETDGGRLVAYDFETGAEVDRIPYPPGVTDVQMYQGLLLGWSSATEEVSVLE